MFRNVHLLMPFVASACLVVGCSNTDAGSSSVDAATASPDDAAAPAARRQLLEVSLVGTSPQNLVFDPNFQSLGGDPTMGAPNLQCEGANVGVHYEATSPAGPGRAFLGADFRSANDFCVFSFQGGAGPLELSLWLASSDESSVQPSVAVLSALQQDTQLQLQKDPSTPVQRHGRLTYARYSAVVVGELRGTGMLLVTAPGKTRVDIVAPQVLPSGRLSAVATRWRPTPRAIALALSQRTARLRAFVSDTSGRDDHALGQPAPKSLAAPWRPDWR